MTELAISSKASDRLLFAKLVAGCLTFVLGVPAWLYPFVVIATTVVIAPPFAVYSITPSIHTTIPLLPLIFILIGSQTILFSLRRNRISGQLLAVSTGLLLTILAGNINWSGEGGWPLAWIGYSLTSTAGLESIPYVSLPLFMLDWAFWSVLVGAFIQVVLSRTFKLSVPTPP